MADPINRTGNVGSAAGDIAKNRGLANLQKAISRQVDALHEDGEAGGSAAEEVVGAVGDQGRGAQDQGGERERDGQGRFAKDGDREREPRGYDFGSNLIPPPPIPPKSAEELGEAEAAEPKAKSEAEGAQPEGTPESQPQSKPVDPKYFESLSEHRRNAIKKFAPGNDLGNLKTEADLKAAADAADEHFWKYQQQNAELTAKVSPTSPQPDGQDATPKQVAPADPAKAEGESSPDKPEPIPDIPALKPFRNTLQTIKAKGDRLLAACEAADSEISKLQQKIPAVEALYAKGEAEESAVLNAYRSLKLWQDRRGKAEEDFLQVDQDFQRVYSNALTAKRSLDLASRNDRPEQAASTSAQQGQAGADDGYNARWETSARSVADSFKFDVKTKEGQEAYQEVIDFMAGQTVVEVTKTGARPDPEKIAERARKHFQKSTDTKAASDAEREYHKQKANDAPKAPQPDARRAAPTQPQKGGRRSIRELEKMVFGADL
jgi:hypothetical protein